MVLDTTKPYPKRPRLEDKNSYIGERGYFITINTFKRSKFFSKKAIVQSLITHLKDKADEFDFDVICYCFMPDHVHLVLCGRKETSNLDKFLRSYKQLTGYRFKQKFGFRLWATSYYDSVLRKISEIPTVGRYTLLNPVKAGLVKNVLDYPFSGSFVYELSKLVQEDPWLQNINLDLCEWVEDVTCSVCLRGDVKTKVLSYK